MQSSVLGLGHALSVSVHFSSSGVWNFTHVCRAGVCMCWHSPLVLLDEPASANYLLNKISISATHLYANCISNFLRWKRSKNLQGEIIFCCSVMNTDCRDAEKFIRVSSPLFFDRQHKHQDNSALQKIPRLCLVKTILNWFCMTEPTINNKKKKKIKHKKEKKNGSHPGRKLPSV